MLVSEYIEYAVSSELSPLSVKDIGDLSLEATSTAQSKNRNTIIGYINLANIALHKKFGLLQKEIVINDPVTNTLYTLPEDYLYPVNAALDTGAEVSVNNDRKVMYDDMDRNLSVMFPSQTTFTVKGIEGYLDCTGRSGFALSIVYAAGPPKLCELDDVVPLQLSFLEPALMYIAYKAHGGISATMDSQNNTYYLRYISACKELVTSGLTGNDNLLSNVKLNERGFV